MAFRRSAVKDEVLEPVPEARRQLHARSTGLAQPGEKLGELLVRKERLTHTQLNEALLQQSASGKRIGALLVELGALNEYDLAWALAEQFSLELVDLGRETPEPEAVAVLSESIARTESAIPLRLDGDTLTVVVSDVTPEIIERLNKTAAKAVQSDAFKKLSVNEGLVMLAEPPEALDRYFSGEEARWRKVIEDAGIKPE